LVTPDLSVLTPSLDQGRFIEDSILSVLGQDGLLIEHVVQDGGSKDDTIDVLQRFGDAVRWVSEAERGQSDALNKALDRATGRWVAWLNADDFYLPDGLATLVRHGDETGADIVHGESAHVEEGGLIVGLGGHHRFKQRTSRTVLFYAEVIPSGSMIVRRSALSQAPWDPAFRRIMDQEFFLKLASSGARFSFVRYPAGASRAHDDQVSARPLADFLSEYTTIWERYGIPSSGPRLGKALHRTRKLMTGAYRRQFCAQRLCGRDLRWFRGQPGWETFDELLRTCYANTSSRTV
jgi:glycosyltransferase involved in cell wall biosynthesis